MYKNSIYIYIGPNRDYFKAKVYTIWVHNPVITEVTADVGSPSGRRELSAHERRKPLLSPGFWSTTV